MPPPAGTAGSEFTLVHRALEVVIRTVSSCFLLVALVAIVLGLIWVDNAVIAIRGEGLLKAFEDFGRYLLPAQMDREEARLRWVVVPPVVFGLVIMMLFYRIGRGLRRLSPWARWSALVVLLPACVPPLVLFFAALRAGESLAAIWPLVMLIVPASGALALSLSQSDVLFSQRYRTLVGADPGPLAQNVSKIVLVLYSLGVFVTITVYTIAS
jgi:hypothetical protein